MKEKRKYNTREIALCGMLLTVGTVLLTASGIVPFGTFACPLLSMLAISVITDEFGKKTGIIAYIAEALLGLWLCADKEAAMLFVFLGYYPIIRGILEKITSVVLRVIVKLLIMNLSVFLMYVLLGFIFGILIEDSVVVAFVMLVLGNIVFLLYDAVLNRITDLYRRKWRKYFIK